MAEHIQCPHGRSAGQEAGLRAGQSGCAHPSDVWPEPARLLQGPTGVGCVAASKAEADPSRQDWPASLCSGGGAGLKFVLSRGVGLCESSEASRGQRTLPPPDSVATCWLWIWAGCRLQALVWDREASGATTVLKTQVLTPVSLRTVWNLPMLITSHLHTHCGLLAMLSAWSSVNS
jgi:hypothetical protein